MVHFINYNHNMLAHTIIPSSLGNFRWKFENQEVIPVKFAESCHFLQLAVSWERVCGGSTESGK